MPGRTDGAARLVTWSSDGAAMHLATADVMAEGTVSKRLGSRYVAGRSRHWLKAKHRVIETLQVAGWRSSAPSRPGGLIIAENGEPIAVATLAIPESERAALIELLRRYGRPHPTGSVTIPADRITATVRYTSRTPTHGHLREAVVISIHPRTALSPRIDDLG